MKNQEEEKEIYIHCPCKRNRFTITVKKGDTVRKTCNKCTRGFRVHYNKSGIVTAYTTAPGSYAEEHFEI